MKKIYSIILLAHLLFSTASIFAQNFSIVGNGTAANTSTSYPAPFGNYYWGSRHQFFVTAAQLSAAGITANASISSLGFNVTATNGAAVHQGFTVRVFTTTAADPISTGWVTTGQVAQTNAVNHSPVVGWNQFNFQAPFTWNGTANLVVEVCFNNSSFSNNASTQWTTSGLGTGTWSRWRRADATGVCANTSTTGTLTTTRPNMRFGWGATTNCSGTPNAGSASISSTSGCSGSAITLSATGLTSGTGISYQWQSAPASGGPWTNIAGATSATASVSPSATTFYRLLTTCSNGGATNTTNVVSYTVSGGPCQCGTYASIFASNAADTEISSVSVGSMTNNANTCVTAAPGAGSIAGRYSNFTGSVTGPTAQQGSSVPFTVVQNSCSGNNYGNIIQIYVDWNQNGVFDISEMMYQSPLANNTAPGVSGNFTVPVGATTGTTRMRIVCIEGGTAGLNYAQTSTYTWGETEDYCFTVTAAPICTGTPSPGNTLSSASSVAPNGTVNLSLQNFTSGSGITYQWQSAPSNTGPWTNFGTSSAIQTSPAITSTIWFRSIVTCSGNSGTSNPIQVNVSYCTPTTTNTSDYISGFTTTGGVANIANSPTVLSGTGYGDFFATQTVSQFAGSAINFTETYVGGSHGFSIWVDFNNNFIFETSERLFNAGAIATGHTGSFTIPGGTPAGDYRMRIRAWWNNLSPDPCSLIPWGEAEDYRLTVLASTPCTGTPSPGNTVSSLTSVAAGGTVNLSLQNLTAGTGVTYQWQSAPSNSGPWTNFGTSAATQTSPVINAETWFRCIVTCSGNSGTSTPVQVTLTYCTYNTSVSDVTGITSVVFNTISNASVGDPAYTNFTAQSTSVTQGDVHTLSVRVNTDGAWTVNVRAWIDWNQNLQFEASEEYVLGNAFNVTNGLTSLSPLSITVPLTALPGNTRMRVVAAEISDPQPLACGTQFYGEAEDYTINVIPVVCSTPPTSISNTGTYCLGNQITLSVTGGTLAPGSSWEWFTTSCGGTAAGTGSSITVSPTATTQYFVRAAATSVCPASTCATGTVTMPAAGTNLSTNGETATCIVNGPNWIRFYAPSGNLILAINPNGENLGNVSVTSFVGSPGTMFACDNPGNTLYETAYMGRSWIITSQNPPTNPVSVQYPFSNGELNALETLSTTTVDNLIDDVDDRDDLVLTKFTADNPALENSDPTDNCSISGITRVLPQVANGSNPYGLTNTQYVTFNLLEFSENFLHGSSGPSALPVELTSFTAECNESSVQLHWSTGSELNSDKFIVESSRDMSTWNVLGEVQSVGNSSQTSSYVYVDESSTGLMYYRLRQVDFDGKEEIFNSIFANCNVANNSIVVYPNPTKGEFTIALSSDEQFKNATLIITDVSGKTIVAEPIKIAVGQTEIYKDLTEYKVGTYFIHVKTDKNTFKPIMIVKEQ